MMRVGILMVVCCCAASAQQPTIPDTPAGRTFKAWLDALNSGDRNVIAAYVHEHDPRRTADMILAFRSRTGGFDLSQIVSSQRLHLDALLTDRNTGRPTLVTFDVTDATPPVVTDLRPYPLLPGQSTASISTTIDATTRARVLDSAVAELTTLYVVPAVARQMADALRAHQLRGEYDTISSGARFAERVGRDLDDVTHDVHLHVMFTPVPLPPFDTSRQSPLNADLRRRVQSSNCAFETAEVLPGNIGYLKFNAFDPPDLCGPTATAAMNFLAHTDAIIFDLRQNGGGDGDMVSFILSYLFDQPTHLTDIWTRRDSSTLQNWTLAYVPGDRSIGKPVYVLTSKRTVSAGEAFSYDLKNLKRATIIGEVTAGGANPADAHRIDPRFVISMPFAKAVNPITHTNWERTGVVPDVEVSADSALAVAERMAADTLRATRK